MADAGEELALDRFPAGQPARERVLNGGVHRKEGVGDDFESSERLGAECVGAERGDPADFHLRERGDFGEAGDDECEAGMFACGEAGDGIGQRIVEEDFVDDEGERVADAEFFEGAALGGRGGVAGGVVGMHEEDGPGAGGDAALELGEVDPPAEVVEERVGLEGDIVKGGEEVEERVARLGDEDLVTGVAEQAEEERVALACAGGEDKVGWIDLGIVRGVIGGDSGASGGNAAGVGVVAGGGFDGGERVGEAAGGWIREGEIDERVRGGADGGGEGGFGEVPGGAG